MARDIDLATAAEQSSEEDEAQEGMPLQEQEAESTAAESLAMHVIDDNDVGVDETLEALDDAVDPEADAVVEEALKGYGRHLGTAFQLVDDVLDYSGDLDETGKNIGDVIHINDVVLPEGAKPTIARNFVIANVTAPAGFIGEV